MAEVNYATNGKGNLGVTLGAIGTGLSVLGETGILGGLTGNKSPEQQYVTRYEMGLSQENAVLKAKLEVEQKLNAVSKEFSDQLQAAKDAQAIVNQNQAMYNTANTSAVSVVQSQIQQLMSMTQLVIPNASVNPGWGNVKIVPDFPEPPTPVTPVSA